MAKALWRVLLSVRRSEGVGEEDERDWRSIMGREEKEVVMIEMELAGRYLGALFVRQDEGADQGKHLLIYRCQPLLYDYPPVLRPCRHCNFRTGHHRIPSPVVVGHQW